METYENFSYKEYKEILNHHKLAICNLEEAMGRESFVILRHDVEFSVSRAYKMAQIEENLGIKSYYFFQVSSNAYNVASIQNKKLINEIREMGHNVDLHLYVSHIHPGDWKSALFELEAQKIILESIIDTKISSFAFHRPPKWVLEKRDNQINGLLNLYGNNFFEFSPLPQYIKYIADSMHKWNFGHPLEISNFKKIQINTHPDEWTERGFDTYNNFSSIIEENRLEFVNTIDQETKHFKPYLKQFYK